MNENHFYRSPFRWNEPPMATTHQTMPRPMNFHEPIKRNRCHWVFCIHRTVL